MQLKLDNNGDLDFSNGNIQLIEGEDEIIQKLISRYKFFKGEWYLDSRLGVPFIQLIFKKDTPFNIVTQLLRKVAETCPGIASVTDFTASKDAATRKLSITFNAKLDTGENINFNKDLII